MRRIVDAIMASLKIDGGLQPLAPYLCNIFGDNIWKECNEKNHQTGGFEYHPRKLTLNLRAVECITSNRSLDLSWYLHEIIPTLLNVLLDTPRISIDKRQHPEAQKWDMLRKFRWEQRDHAARALSTMCFWYPEVAPRVQRKMVDALQSNPITSLPSIYGEFL